MRITVVATGLGDNGKKETSPADDILNSVSGANDDDGEFATVLDIFNK